MPGDIRRERRERRRPVDRQEAVRIVLDDRDAEAARDVDDLDAARLRDGVGGRIEQRRIEIERLRRQALAGIGKRIGIDDPHRPSAMPTSRSPSCAAIERAPG